LTRAICPSSHLPPDTHPPPRHPCHGLTRPHQKDRPDRGRPSRCFPYRTPHDQGSLQRLAGLHYPILSGLLCPFPSVRPPFSLVPRLFKGLRHACPFPNGFLLLAFFFLTVPIAYFFLPQIRFAQTQNATFFPTECRRQCPNIESSPPNPFAIPPHPLRFYP